MACCCGAAALRAAAALLGRFLPRLGPLALQAAPFFVPTLISIRKLGAMAFGRAPMPANLRLLAPMIYSAAAG